MIILAPPRKIKEDLIVMSTNDTMARVLLTLTQSDEWFRICDNDNGIAEANAQLQIIIDKLASDNPDELTEQLWEAVCNVNDACCAAAMLYGIRVANAIRDVSAQQLDLTMKALRQSRELGKRNITKQS